MDSTLILDCIPLRLTYRLPSQPGRVQRTSCQRHLHRASSYRARSLARRDAFALRGRWHDRAASVISRVPLLRHLYLSFQRYRALPLFLRHGRRANITPPFAYDCSSCGGIYGDGWTSPLRAWCIICGRVVLPNDISLRARRFLAAARPLKHALVANHHSSWRHAIGHAAARAFCRYLQQIPLSSLHSCLAVFVVPARARYVPFTTFSSRKTTTGDARYAASLDAARSR